MTLFAKTFATFGLLAAFVSPSAFADTYRHIDDLASDIERKSRQIEKETRHYRHTPEYRHLVEDARDMRRLADHMHDVAHDHGSLAHLESDLQELDAKFHHLESVFDRVERRAFHGHGHVHGDTSHVKRLLNAIEDDIHHLQDDLRSLRAPAYDCPRELVSRPPIYSAPPARHWDDHRSHSSRYGYGRGITIGGGSSRFTIRW
ncbi:hypothetical protein Enr13x_55570 [Stieleria neptunia]|uniref:Chromosome partition protein Smc n=1 Tax=Stieleria neptunia TaxID=2527979 RepID=A0A518HXU5_9BACT|nr:hypothetical protein [Stieleria neptunia]QDV45678.1 hypothetical protein Enr13x_55570 [Stieleria neptunia]